MLALEGTALNGKSEHHWGKKEFIHGVSTPWSIRSGVRKANMENQADTVSEPEWDGRGNVNCQLSGKLIK